MSGGHFDYKESYLTYIAEQLEQDIKYNNIHYDEAVGKEYEKRYGYQLEPKTIAFLQKVADQLYYLHDILREYDHSVSGDSSEDSFQERFNIK
ncbi:MAG: hypothetical protein DM484_28000 [Candidatus Methylumidiphilus alinenensis]|uniref:Uncharacterized protein n=1 Tax=Candidatus Methylumidiphilus alinenensis TaxID=2202197 RepID=A0A2W4SAC7_9GAMM|nr:MAG: hypothetical protein DM484_28000 [Candidatus Methylumidiphilus alinenensis]